MNDYIEIPLCIGIVGLTAWCIAKFGRLIRFSMAWQFALGGAAVVCAVISSFTVMGLGDAFFFAGVFCLWVFLWLILFVVYVRHDREKDLGLLICYPLIYILIAWASQTITDPQIEKARVQADAVIKRLEDFKQSRGAYPESFNDLISFDGVHIPKTDIGLWGNQEFGYWRHLDGEGCTIYIEEMGALVHFRSPGGEWWADD